MAKISIKRRDDAPRLDGTAALYLIVNIGRERLRIHTGLYASKKDWDPLKERLKARTKEAENINLLIEQVRSRANDIIVRARMAGELITGRDFIASYEAGVTEGGFLGFAYKRLRSLRSVVQYNTYSHEMSALKKLEAYAPKLSFREITTDWLRIYSAYLRDHHGNNNSTINKNLCVIRQHYYAAMRAGLVKNNPFEAFRMPRPTPAIVYLTEEELKSLISLYKSDTLCQQEQIALRFFLFMAFTAMHISDAKALCIEQIFAGEIHYNRIKTHTQVIMPVSKPTAQLIEYYKGQRLRGTLIKELPSDQSFNRLIKIVCQRVGIRKSVSAKAARHTFATLYYKKNPGDVGTLSKLLGHTSITTTMIYAHIMKDSRVKGVSAFDDMM